ncbi:glycosyl hydrolase family 18 protein [Motilimonas sp. E26]|uniref:glycosyl hydrolase family 18 protein n=1 Tax=Motilimonas sp. E26 TaxID=2865674 RepID=UPI001E527599|nr:glycosyl hydrolase family 18 protein [Motilimonas sp. E26]MCE0559335.1 LytTR family transcriptional regulator DNA-binding domain-containing protein [Motilimonas sp. E26]
MRKFLTILLIILLPHTAFASEKLVVGQFFGWNGQVSDLQVEPLTHLVYNHLDLTETASINVLLPKQELKHLTALHKLKQRKPSLKLLASIGGWALSKNYPLVTSNEKLSQQFIDNIGTLLSEGVFDGVSIDWRYPGVSRESTVGNRDSDGGNLLALIIRIRETYPNIPLFMTVSVLTDDLIYLPIKQISQYVDAIEILSLDLAGHWQNKSGHSSPLFTPKDSPAIFTGSLDEAVQHLLNQQVPSDKLIVSIPAFGHGWLGVKNNNQGLFQPSESIPKGDYTPKGQPNTGLYSQQSIQDLYFAENYQSYWDDQAKASYLFNMQTGHFISFESTRSLKEKVAYINHYQLAGMSIQDLGADVSLVTQAANLLNTNKLPAIDTHQINLKLISLTLLLLLSAGFLGFYWYRRAINHNQQQQEMAKELLHLQLQQASLPTTSNEDITELKKELEQQQQKYNLTLEDQSITAQLQQMMGHLSSHLQQVTNDPTLLSELHKISSNKNRLLYIQAEKGYTGLYLHNQDKPEYIYTRLKQLKRYYDDEFLVQIHRSYLVSAQKVEGVFENNEGKLMIQIGNKTLPIGGSYIAKLQQNFNHWFN